MVDSDESDIGVFLLPPGKETYAIFGGVGSIDIQAPCQDNLLVVSSGIESSLRINAKPPLKSLKEFNKERWDAAWELGVPYNGIACPDCGEEMVDAYPVQPVPGAMSGIPEMKVRCRECGFRGHRLA